MHRSHLIGMGRIDKFARSSSGTYRFVDQRRSLDAVLEQLGVGENVTLPGDCSSSTIVASGPLCAVGRDRGSALAFDWANRHRDQVKGIAHMEAPVQPWSEVHWPVPAEGLITFLALRSEQGEG
jgi:haloalkane dehalogenase